MKKIFLILAIVVGLAVLGAGVYFAWKNLSAKDAPLPDDSLENPSVQVPAQTAPQREVKAIGSQKAIFSWAVGGTATSSAPEIFYISDEGKIFKITDGQEELVSDRVFSDINLVKASLDGQKIFVKNGNLDTVRFEIFDLKTRVWQPLTSGALEADFSPDAKKIAYFLAGKSGKADLMVKELGTAKQKETKIISLNQKDMGLEWVAAEKILLVPKPSAKYAAEIWALDLNSKKLSKITSGEGLAISWAKGENNSVRFGKEGAGYGLAAVNGAGEKLVNFNFKTLPQKCSALTSLKIYCAVPRNQQDFLSRDLPDDYLQRDFYPVDSLLYLDLADRSKSAIIYEGEKALDAINLFSVGKNLYFINRYDNKLYSAAL